MTDASPSSTSRPVAGVILAGGLARRMGGADKALVDLAGRPLLAHVIERFAPQVAPLLISANGDAARLSAFALPVVADPLPGHLGPLAGLAAAALWLAADHPEVRLLASVAVDSPHLPRDLVARLAAALDAAPAARSAVAASGGRIHPVAALHRVEGLADLVADLASGATRRVMSWLETRDFVTVEFVDRDGDPFVNLNRPDDVAALAARPARK